MAHEPSTPVRRWTTAVLATLAFAAPALAQEATTTVTGEVRMRSEAFRPLPAEEWDTYTLLRTRIGLLAAVNPNLRAFVQLQDARVFGEELSTMHGSANSLDLHQGYLEIEGRLVGAPLVLRAGRQEILLGNERLVGAVGWSNTGRSFDAARLTLGGAANPLNTTAFFATVHEGGARYGGVNGLDLDGDHWFTGLSARWNQVAEGYALYDRNAHFARYTNVNRATLGGRLQPMLPGPLTASLEGAYQLGRQHFSPVSGLPRAQDIRAWFTGARLGVATGLTAVPSVGLGLDILSGDDDPTGDEYRAFNTLYATNHKFYGYMDLFLDPAARTHGRGLVDAIASARAGLGRYGAVDVDLHRFLLTNDVGLDSRDLGWELDLSYPFTVAGAGRITLGYSAFRNGGAAPTIGLGEDGKVWHWGFVQASVGF
jgi:hypothetical protein